MNIWNLFHPWERISKSFFTSKKYQKCVTCKVNSIFNVKPLNILQVFLTSSNTSYVSYLYTLVQKNRRLGLQLMSNFEWLDLHQLNSIHDALAGLSIQFNTNNHPLNMRRHIRMIKLVTCEEDKASRFIQLDGCIPCQFINWFGIPWKLLKIKKMKLQISWAKKI